MKQLMTFFLLSVSAIGISTAALADEATNAIHKKMQIKTEKETKNESPEMPLDSIAAVVNDTVITQNELDKRIAAIKQQMAASKQPLPDEKTIRDMVLQNLINVKLQLQLAKKLGVEATSKDVDDAIDNIAKRNNLDKEKLEVSLRQAGMSYKEYRKNIQQQIIIGRLQQNAVSRHITISEQQIDNYIKHHPALFHQKQEYNIQDILFPLPESVDRKAMDVVKKRAENYLATLKKNPKNEKIAEADESVKVNEFGWRKLAAIPKLFANRVLKMKKGEVAGLIKAPNGYHILVLKDVRGETVKQMIKQTHARHILLNVDVVHDSKTVKKRADELYAEIKQGADFAETATNYSDDTGSATKGGDLGWVSPGMLVPPFEKAMNALKPGEISHPIKTRYGWHIIQLISRREIDNTQAKQRRQVREVLYRQRFSVQLQSWLQELRNQSFIKIHQVS